MNKKIGFIGYGNMAQAMANGICDGGLQEKDILITDIEQQKIELAKKHGFSVNYNQIEIAKLANVLIIATKPDQYQSVIEEIKNHINPETIVISIAAGLTIEIIENYFARPLKLVRAMPNTPAKIKRGMTAIIPNQHMVSEDIALISELFSWFGQIEIVDEALIEAVIVTSGSSPAYVYMLIEAMIQGGINEGMTREMATRFASSAVMGAAKMVTETGVLPNDLRDAVCSPNGTTIEAVKSLQAAGFEAIIIKAMKACTDRSRAMAKE